MSGIITKISGPAVTARGMQKSMMYNLVYVGSMRLIGEVIRIEGDSATIQVYEDTYGLKLGEEIADTGEPLCVELGPGLLSSVFDGVQRPLGDIADKYKSFMPAGVALSSLNRSKKWHFTPLVKRGDAVDEGDAIGMIRETAGINHLIMTPPGVHGIIKDIEDTTLSVEDKAAMLEDGTIIRSFQRWPVRRPRPVKKKHPSTIPFITGQRIIDTLFPVAIGGSVIIPGGFGTGKTVLEQAISKFAGSDVIIYIGCGERGNEIAEVLSYFPELVDPYTGQPLMNRTVLVVNTSNMPVAAREASIYTGITIGEYYRDMGYNVAILADSISRWAEAMREISGRLEELPGEEGFPMYLSSRIASYFERAGVVECLCNGGRMGSITICSAISPPGGDFSEPVTQSALRATGTMWALDTNLARRRHFPAINWGKSFSLYSLDNWFRENIAEEWPEMRKWLVNLLRKEEELQDIIQLIGPDALRDQDRIVVEMGILIRENYLQQSPYSPVDAFCSVEKQLSLLKIFHDFYRIAVKELEKGIGIDGIFTPARKLMLKEMKNIPGEKFPIAGEEIMSGVLTKGNEN